VTAADVVARYFDAIRSRDADALRDLFAADAELVTVTGTVRGADAVADWYRRLAFTARELSPAPGPLLVDGDRVAVEIELTMDGTTSLVGDFFSIADGHITRLVIYTGPPVP
jgi:ketosteroid isomerase-like protein